MFSARNMFLDVNPGDTQTWCSVATGIFLGFPCQFATKQLCIRENLCGKCTWKRLLTWLIETLIVNCSNKAIICVSL